MFKSVVLPNEANESIYTIFSVMPSDVGLNFAGVRKHSFEHTDISQDGPVFQGRRATE